MGMGGGRPSAKRGKRNKRNQSRVHIKLIEKRQKRQKGKPVLLGLTPGRVKKGMKKGPPEGNRRGVGLLVGEVKKVQERDMCPATRGGEKLKRSRPKAPRVSWAKRIQSIGQGG